MYSVSITKQHATLRNNNLAGDLSKLWKTALSAMKSLLPQKSTPLPKGQQQAAIIRERLQRPAPQQSVCGSYRAVTDPTMSESGVRRLRNRQRTVISDSSMRFKRNTQEKDHFHVERSSEQWRNLNNQIDPLG